MSSPAAVRLVASREISTRLRSKAYLISTGVLLLLIIAATVVVKLLSGDGSDYTVGVTGPTSQLSAPLQASGKILGQTVATVEVADEAAGRAKVSDGSLDALLVGDGQSLQVVVKKTSTAS
jgi:ABC-2 type transport system permease protein